MRNKLLLESINVMLNRLMVHRRSSQTSRGMRRENVGQPLPYTLVLLMLHGVVYFFYYNVFSC